MTGQSETLRAFVALAFAQEAQSALVLASTDLQRASWAEFVRWSPPENLHLTLHFLGDIPLTGVAPLMEALDTGMRDVAAFDCALDGLALFPDAARPRAIVGRVTEEPLIASLAGAVGEAVAGLGHEREARRFRPHITLGRLRRGALRELSLTAELERASVPVDEVVLYRSTLASSGSSYEVLGRVPLGPVREA